MSAPNSGPYSFSRLRPAHATEANELQAICKDIAKKGVLGKDLAERIHVVGQNIPTFTLAEVNTYLNPAITAIAFEREQVRGLRLVTILRNFLILIPLAFTWWALQEATQQYQADLLSHPDDVYRPFLDLWQNGFNMHALTFSMVAVIDVALYIAIILVGVFADGITSSSQGAGRRIQVQLMRASKILDEIIISDNHNMPSNTTDISPWLNQVQGLLTNASSLIESVGTQMAAFQGSVTAIGNSAASIGSSATQLLTGATTLSSAVQGMASSAGTMATAATATSTAATELNRQVGGLHSTINSASSTLSTTVGTIVDRSTNMMTTSIGQLGRDQQQQTTQLTRMAEAVNNVANNTNQSANAITRSLTGFDRALNDTQRVINNVMRQMGLIDRNQQRINRDQEGAMRGIFSLFRRRPPHGQDPAEGVPQPVPPTGPPGSNVPNSMQRPPVPSMAQQQWPQGQQGMPPHTP